LPESARDLKRRIKAIKNTQQITKAMQMVAAAKLRKAQNRAVSARAYTDKLTEMLRRLTADGGHLGHPFLRARLVRRVALVVVTSDRGLAGSYNANLIRRAEAVLRRLGESETPVEVELTVVGRKSRDYFRRKGPAPAMEFIRVEDEDLGSLSDRLSGELMKRFSRGEFDEVLMVYSRFLSALSQRTEEMRLLPVAGPEAAAEAEQAGPARTEEEEEEDDRSSGRDWEAHAGARERSRAAPAAAEADLNYVYQPDPQTVYALLLPRAVTNRMFHALLEARASEYAARMAAMSAATDNAEDMIDRLTLEMNRARQASITQEIMELVGGAEALKKA